MNLFQITSTTGKAMIRWQDCSVTQETSADLVPYLNPDDNEVWPGGKVSFISEEEKLGGDVPDVIRIRKIGVVQSVNAAERIAAVRWYEDAEIDVDGHKSMQFSGSKYGTLGQDPVELPLYDIAAHPALAANLGDLALVPSMPEVATANFEASHSSPDGAAHLIVWAYGGQEYLSMAEGAFRAMPSISTTQVFTRSPQTDRLGEVVDLCLDGKVTVRLGAARAVRDIFVAPEDAWVVVPADASSSGDSDEDMEGSDQDDAESDIEDTDEEIFTKVEYKGGLKIGTTNDEDMWTTDEEDIGNRITHMTSNLEKSAPSDHGNRSLEPCESRANPCKNLSPITYSVYSSMPPRFTVLEGPAPSDHHFASTSRPLIADLMRRIIKEHKIMKSSLPDGVFVRTWDSRLDLLRVLIIGPYDTPYEFAPFAFDFQFGPSFPSTSPDAYFHSWTGNLGQINPNLYENGKICLSLLGTWHADEQNEIWSP